VAAWRGAMSGTRMVGPSPGRSGGECELVASDLEQVVDDGDESPLAGDRGEAASGESAEPKVRSIGPWCLRRFRKRQ
jgi:hypothetical protein